jgi:exodeoxyribonuclease V alpha subunit
MASKDPVVREAACMLRALRLCSARPDSLPPLSALKAVALEHRLDLPGVLRSRDAKRLGEQRLASGVLPPTLRAEAGRAGHLRLTDQVCRALFRAFPDEAATARLDAGARLMLAGLAPRLVPAALEAWGARDAPARLARDPYGGVHELKGTVEEADAVLAAQAAGGGAGADKLAGRARWALLGAGRDGHTALSTSEVIARARRGLAATPDDVGRALAAAVDRGELAALAGGEALARPDVLRAERALEAAIRDRVAAGDPAAGDPAAGDPAAGDPADDPAAGPAFAGLADEQLAAVRALARAPLAVLTGGPGTGKSTVVRALVAAAGEDRCLLTAPTGRAARNVGGNTVHSASGGRLLRAGGRLARRPLQETTADDVPKDIKLLVVDEASMLDTELMVGVLALAPRGCRVLLVGDPDQLPPVGAGSVLVDLIASGVVPVARLAHNHRCAAGVSALAARVLGGRLDFEDDPGCEAVRLARAGTPGEAMAAVVREAAAAAAAGESWAVLAPLNATRHLLNRALQSALSPAAVRVEIRRAPGSPASPAPGGGGTYGVLRTGPDGVSELVRGDGSVSKLAVDQALTLTRPLADMYPGDLVMALRNQSRGKRAAAGGGGGFFACNGDVGVLESLSALGAVVDFGGETARFPKADGWLALAYAATVHKYQGSECDVVIVPLASGGWDRALLYTAVTRARRRVVLVGTARDAESAASRVRPPRCSALAMLLNKSV